MKRTATLLEEIYKYSEKLNKSDVCEIIAPIVLVFFQQWNYNLIKTYGKDNFKSYMINEHKQAELNPYFKQAEKSFIFKKNVQPYIYKMGYTRRGKIFMKLYMLLSLLGFYKLSVRLRTIF